jgi:hypothetical protein
MRRVYTARPGPTRIDVAYGSVPHILRLSDDDLISLRWNGLRTVFVTLESGSDRIRCDIFGKTYSTEDVVLAVKKLVDAGIRANVIFMLGTHADLSIEHASETARVLARLSNLAKGEPTLLRFSFSPIDRNHASPKLLSACDSDRVIGEFHALGHLHATSSHYFSSVTGFRISK